MNGTGKKGFRETVMGIFRGFSVFFTVVLFIIMFTPLSNYMAKTLVVPQELKKTDLIVIMGGGAYPNGELGGASTERLIRGMLLYKDGYAPEMMFSGGTIRRTSKKVLHTVLKSDDATKIDVVEADLMKEVSLKLGIPEEDAAVDSSSTDTHGNLKAVRAYMESRGLGSCLIVTSPTHMRRSMSVAKKLGMDCYPAPIGDYTGYIKSATGRFWLFRTVMWEYAGFLLYRLYGYI